jgi:hypothetical protein
LKALYLEVEMERIRMERRRGEERLKGERWVNKR